MNNFPIIAHTVPLSIFEAAVWKDTAQLVAAAFVEPFAFGIWNRDNGIKLPDSHGLCNGFQAVIKGMSQPQSSGIFRKVDGCFSHPCISGTGPEFADVGIAQKAVVSKDAEPDIFLRFS